jgi:tetratricopeptide (TPR) repeat protein
MASNDSPRLPDILVSPEQLPAVQALYDQGLYLQAYRATEGIGPLARWSGTAARLLAGRLAGNLGGGRLGTWHFIRAWRADPLHHHACWYYANHLADTRGPWKAWQYLQQRGDMPEASLENQSHWCSLHADILGQLRDFAAAEEWLTKAEALGLNHPWTYLSRAMLCSYEDRHDEALEAARQALAIQPNYRPGIQWLAHFLVQKEADAEAEALLRDATCKLESCAIWSQLAGLQVEQHRYEDARVSLDETERLAPLKDKELAQWLAARRSDVAYHTGQPGEALEFARQVKGKFFETLVNRLESPAEPRRVALPVPFVRQNFDTCAPATLAAICRLWSMPGDHLEVAAAITYAGTPNHSERQWAEDHGWRTREFTVTWESAVALLDHGIPFTLTTPEPNASHLQAVIGYDNIRHTLLLRDPNERHQVEMMGDALHDRYRATGPRGMALVPVAQSDRLNEIDLPDAELWDLRFQIDRALEANQREGANELQRKLEEKAPGHRITHWVRRTLAAYDGDTTQELAAVDQLIALFPDDLSLQLSRVSLLQSFARHDECLAQLRKLCEQKETHPTCWQLYAQELIDDAREHREAQRWLRRVLRSDPRGALSYHCLARIRSAERRMDEVLQLSRFAACLDEKDEFYARAYFNNARGVGHSEGALRFLRERFTRFGKKSGLPARTLSWAYFELDRSAEAFAVLDEGLALRPEDGDLILHAVESWRVNGEFDRAEELLQRAEGHAHPADWLRASARLKDSRGELISARDIWAQVIQQQPLATDAHAAYAHLLAETDSRQAALRHIEATCGRFPHNYPLHQLWIDWLQDEGPAAVEPVVRQLIDIHPADGWARRELALALANQQKIDEALAELEVAARVEPGSVSLYTVKEHLLTLAGRIDEARECCREAVRLSADSDVAINDWMALCDTQAERREALQFIEQEMMRQVLSGEGLLAYRDAGLYTLPREELLVSLRRTLDARPDLWQAWAAVTRQLREMELLDEALAVASQAVERFPLLPIMWVDLADVHFDRKELKACASSLQHALHINPDWPLPLRRLTALYESQERSDKARTLLRKAISRAPLVVDHHVALAKSLWYNGQHAKALSAVQHALKIDRGNVEAWEAFCGWAWSLDQFDKVLDYARAQTTQRPGEARTWMHLAEAIGQLLRFQPGPEDEERLPECLAAYDRAIELNPRLLEAYDQKAQLLAERGQFREAEAACHAAIWNGRPPLMLRGRLAWVIAQRGNIGRAIKIMRTTVEEDPSYQWGWGHLADWYENRGRSKKHLQAAEHLIELTPDDARGYIHRAEANRHLGHVESAIQDYHRALEIDPGSPYPAFPLFDHYMDAGDHKSAGSVLRTIKQHADREDYLRGALRLTIAQKQANKALKHLERICAESHGNEDEMAFAVEQFIEAGWDRRCENVLWKRLAIGRGVAKQWVQLARRRLSWKGVIQRIDRLPNRDRRKAAGILAVADVLAHEGKHSRMRSLLKAHDALLRSRTEWWGEAGHHFSFILDDRGVAEWMHDWRKRRGVQSWMLLNLGLALTGLKRWLEAQEVHRFAVEQTDPDYTHSLHETWIAFAAALDFGVTEIADFFARHDVDDLDPNHQWIAGLTQALQIALRGRDKTKSLARAKKHLMAVAGRIDPIEPDICYVVAYRMTTRRIAEICGQEWGKPRTILPKRR